MDIQTWFSSIPKITRGYMVGAFVVTFAITYKMIDPEYLLLDFEKVFTSFQVELF